MISRQALLSSLRRFAALTGSTAWLIAVPLVSHAETSGSPTLEAVKARGVLACGVTTGSPGMSLADSKGVMQGLDADGCRAIAAVALGDAHKVRFVPLTSTNRFTALQSGEIDVLMRQTTWTLTREANLGLLFTGVNYYDGAGFLVKTAAKIKSAMGLNGATICVQPGTSTELVLAEYFRVNKMKFTPILIDNVNEIESAFVSGRCDVFSSDGSALAAFRFAQGAKASDFTLLPEVISKEPLGPIVRKGDDKWFDLVRWTHFAALTAEELGVTSKNIDTFEKSTSPDVRRLLGLEGDLGKALGVDNRWAYNEIKQVGNFGELWDRSIRPMGVQRTLNSLWNKGGLQYAPPLR